MPIDGSITGNIDRQQVVDLLPDRAAPLHKHSSNVVDRSFRQTATPLNAPENIIGTLVEAAGHVGTAAGTYMKQQVEEDKIKQESNFWNGMAPDDDATHAGKVTHALLRANTMALESTAKLKKMAETFTGSDEEWSTTVAKENTENSNVLSSLYPDLQNSDLLSKGLSTMYREQMPSIAATRIGAKLAQEHEARLGTFRDNIRVRVDGLSLDEAGSVLDGVMEDSDSLQLTRGEREKALAALAIEKATSGDTSLIEYTKRYKGGQETSLWERSHALQKAEVDGNKVYWMQHQDQIAANKQWLQEKMDNGELTRDEFFWAAAEMNRQFSNLAYTDDSMLSAANRSKKDTPWLQQAAFAKSVGATTDELNSGKFKGNRSAFFDRAGQDNVKHNAMVWTDNAMREAWEKHEKATAENTDIAGYTSEFFTQTVAGSVPLGQRGLDTKTNDAIIESAKKVIDREGKREIAALPLNHDPQEEQAIKDKYTASYMQYLSASRLKDPEFVRLLSSFKLTDMADAPNMKNLNPNTKKAIQLYSSMDVGAKSVHLPDKADRAVFENYLSFVEQGHSEVSAMEKAIFAHRNPRNLSPDNLKAIKAASLEAANASTSRYGSKAGFWPGAVYMGKASETAPDWYKTLHAEESEKGTLANMLGGVVDPKTAAKLWRSGFEASHTKLPNGTFVKGTLPVLADRMKVVPEDVTKYFNTYLEMNKHTLEDLGHVDISEMYFVTNPERGTFQVKTRLGDTLNMPAPLTDLKRGAGAFLDSKKSGIMAKLKELGSDGFKVDFTELSKPEMHVEHKENLVRTIAMVEGNGGYDQRAGAFKPYRDGNGNQWNIGYGLAISDKEYNQDYIIREGQRYNLGRVKPSQITLNVAKRLMDAELSRGEKEIQGYWKDYDKLPDKYKGVLMSLHYNTGSVRPSNWPRLLEAMQNNNDAGVRKEMITSYTNKKGDKIILKNRANTVANRLGIK